MEFIAIPFLTFSVSLLLSAFAYLKGRITAEHKTMDSIHFERNTCPERGEKFLESRYAAIPAFICYNLNPLQSASGITISVTKHIQPTLYFPHASSCREDPVSVSISLITEAGC